MPVEYNEAKQNLMKSQSDELQAKYDYLFRTKILDFYKGEPIDKKRSIILVVVFDSPIEYFFNLRNLENDSKAVLAGIFTIRSIIFPFIALISHPL